MAFTTTMIGDVEAPGGGRHGGDVCSMVVIEVAKIAAGDN